MAVEGKPPRAWCFRKVSRIKQQTNLQLRSNTESSKRVYEGVPPHFTPHDAAKARQVDASEIRQHSACVVRRDQFSSVLCLPIKGFAAKRLALKSALLVVAQARFVVRKEHLGDDLTATAHTGLVEDTFEVLLDGLS